MEMDSTHSSNDIFCKEKTLQGDSFDYFEFQNKLIEVVEELRLKRKLEEENENIIKSLLEDKFEMERKMEEQQRIHQREKCLLEESIANLKKKIEDNYCQSDDDKMKQHHVERIFSLEICALKDEARILHAEKLSLEKKVNEIQGNLKLFNSFQETAMNQLNDVRQYAKTLSYSCQELLRSQNDLKENVTQANSMTAKFKLSVDHLYQVVSLLKKKNATLKQEVISLRTQLEKLNVSSFAPKQTSSLEVLKLTQVGTWQELQNTVSLEEMLKLSRSENKKILKSLVDSTELLNQYLGRVEESEKLREKALAEVDQYKEEMASIEEAFRAKERDWRLTESNYTDCIRKWREKEMMQEDKYETGTQTEELLPQTYMADSLEVNNVSLIPENSSQDSSTLNKSLYPPQAKVFATTSEKSDAAIVCDIAPSSLGIYISSNSCILDGKSSISETKVMEHHLLESEQLSIYGKKLFSCKEISQTLNITQTVDRSADYHITNTISINSTEINSVDEGLQMCTNHEYGNHSQMSVSINPEINSTTDKRAESSVFSLHGENEIHKD